MPKSDNRDRILTHAAQLVRRQGFNNTGIQEILIQAGVPKGSFYFYFKSKEDLGLALIDYYASGITSMIESLLKAAGSSPLQRLEHFFEGFRQLCDQEEWKSGCPIGNLTQEMGTLNLAFQDKLKGVFVRMALGIRECLQEARASEQIDRSLDLDDTADFIVNSWEGALLRVKAEGNTEPLRIFQKMIFGLILKT
jgi:TetR/AcrR family transcriptional regulator, transcriptional repressor for nem operon